MKITNQGNNNAILFIHGGPGLDSSYFDGYFFPLSDKYDLIFYDQDFGLDSENMTLSLCKQLYGKIEDLLKNYKDVVIYTHSWGSYLLLEMMKLLDKENKLLGNVKKVIISNPTATTWSGFNESGDRLFGKMPDEIINKISNCTDGIKLIEMALPYYTGNLETVPEIKFRKYDMDAYNKLTSEMENYNISNVALLLDSSKTYVIYCANDFEDKTGSPELASKCICVSFEGAGHFPFAEKQKKYIELILRLLEE